MTSAYQPSDELEMLLDVLCDDELTPEQSRRLEEIVASDEDACWHYLCRIHLHGTLHWNSAAVEEAVVSQWPVASTEWSGGSVQGAGKVVSGQWSVASDTDSKSRNPEIAKSQISNPQPLILDSSPSPAGVPALGSPSFIDNPAFPYLFSTLAMCLGILAAWLYQVDVPQPIADYRQPSGHPSRLLPAETIDYVGQVTGMVDVHWGNEPLKTSRQDRGLADHKSEYWNRKSLVALGDKFVFSSGLLEITYASGAKVILQGPVAYEVDSQDGGYLSIGKLTARLEKRGEGQKEVASSQWPVASKEGLEASRQDIEVVNHKSEIRNHKSLGPQSPAPTFAVRTPTATVTDLGTEFGVEVDRRGATQSHVFRGSIKVRTILVGHAGQEQEVVAFANESVFVNKSEDNLADARITVRRNVVVDDRFVRLMPKSRNEWSLRVLAWFRLGEDDPGAIAGHLADEKTINHGQPRRLERLGSPEYVANTAVPGSSLAIRFAGRDECFFNRYIFMQPESNFILEAWACAKQIDLPPSIIAYKGNTAENGYGLLLQDGRWQYFFGGIAFADSGVACEPGKWTHLALVHENGRTQLWINGRPAAKSCTDQAFHRPDASFMIGGNPRQPSETFNGQIDEVRYSEFPSPFRPEMLLLSKEQPAAKNQINPLKIKKVDTTDSSPVGSHERSLNRKDQPQ